MAGCTGDVFKEDAEFTVAGEDGVVYDVTLHVYGVVELRSDYQGGMRRKGTTGNTQSSGDFFYEGGSYTPGAGYNVYGVRVTPAVEGPPETDGGNNYFLNARDPSPEGHEVYELDFEATIPVMAGGTVTFSAYDPNCLQIMNNAETVRPMGTGTGPNGALVIDELASTEPPPPSDFNQPLETNGRTGQWIYLDVTNVTAH
jgi:hypothetical protein